VFDAYENTSSLRDFKVKITHATSDRDEQIARATRALKGADELRLRRADLAVAHSRAKELADTLEKVKKSNEESTCIHACLARLDNTVYIQIIDSASM
jgi:ribosome maturation protein Sdo1